MYSDLTFSVYFSLGDYQSLAGITTDLSYEITGIPTNVNSSIRVESQIPYSTQTISATLYHYLGLVQTTTQYTVVNNNSTDNTTTIPITTPTIVVAQITDSIPQYSIYIAIVVIVILLILFFFFFITVIVVCFLFKRRAPRKNRSNSNTHTNPMTFEMPAHHNPTFEDDIKLSFSTDNNGIHSYMQKDDTNPSKKQDEADVVMGNTFSSEIFASINSIS